MLDLSMGIHFYAMDKVISPLNRNDQLGRFIPAFEGLEPYAGKFARAVLRGKRP